MRTQRWQRAQRRTVRLAVATCICATTFVSELLAQDVSPRVHIIATGGTISNARAGRLTVEELSAAMPDVGHFATLSHEQFSNVGSSVITLQQWLELARRINQLFQGDPELTGIVLTSGTDTLEETAFFLHLTVRDVRPVVVVGAMRPPDRLGYEGPANLLEGVRVAASPNARGRGVLVVLNDEINSARDVMKTNANRLQTFRSGDYGLLGVVDRDRVVFFRETVHRHTARGEFDVSAVRELPPVEIVLSYQGSSGGLIRAAVDGGARGVVIAGAGAGATTGTQNDGIDYALEKGVAVVRASRTGAGRVVRGELPANATEAQKRRRQLMVPAEDHAPLKARILLMLALTKTNERADIERMFLEY
jgi:L-asparaginase